ncbi:MAG: xanthine dehydrogenase family protein molybdopterin-binding subunit, partial [Thermoprotei archaeon]
MRTGATKDGRLVAHYGEYYLDAGAYADYTVNVARAVGLTAFGPYEVPNVHVDTYAVYTNKVPTTAFRGFGMQELYFAVESQMDELAYELGMDPVEFRLKNVVVPGKSRMADGELLREDAGAPADVIKEAAKLIEWDKPSEKPKEPWKIRAKGLAAFYKGPIQPSNAAASAIVKVNEDGGVDVLVGTGEMGQGTITALAQIVAEELGIPVEKVRIAPIRSTDTVAYTWQTVGSRGLFTDGQALMRALEDLKRKIRVVASNIFRVSEDRIEIKDGKACVSGEPHHCVTLDQLALGYMLPSGMTIGGPLMGVGTHVPDRNVLTDPETGQVLEDGHLAPFYTFGAGAVEIELNLLTGEIKVLKVVTVFDTPALNPGLAEGQAIGGAVMGINIALRETIIYDEEGKYKGLFPEGMLLNPCLSNYVLFRAADIPEEFKIKFLGVKQKDAPFGAKGIGELVMIAWPAALANAVRRAIGIRITELPLSPDRIIREIKKHKPELLKDVEKYLELSL